MHTYSVSEFTAAIELTLRSAFATSVSLEGEVSNFKMSSNGHWYFTLKDTKSSVQIVMFKGANSVVKNIPRNGDTAVIIGDVSFYKDRGQFQIICTFLTTSGIGAILARLEALKQRCKEAGLFDENKKKNLPPFPSNVGIITSRESAAFKDIKRTFVNNNARVHGFVFHCAVQGDEAAAEITQQIQHANENYPHLDVLLLSRGGGSLEDLLPFSDEQVIRAIAQSRIPIISAVGHEIDMPLCEYAADVRAHTPTDGAEIICKALYAVEEKIQNFVQNLHAAFYKLIEEQKHLIRQFSPNTLIRTFLDKTQSLRQNIDHYTEQMHAAIKHTCRYTATNVEKMKQIIQASSPNTILAKGFSLIYSVDKTHIYSSVTELKKNTDVIITMKDGEKTATIKEI